MRPRGPQEASGAAPQALQRPPGGIKKASPSSKSRFLLLCAEGVAGDAPQALSIKATQYEHHYDDEVLNEEAYEEEEEGHNN